MAAPKPRLCRLTKAADFKSYGFNFFASPGSSSRFIGKVERKSPAERSGLRKNDRLVEVNGVNVERSSQKEILARISEREGEVTLLVVDENTDRYYQERQLPITEALLHDPVPVAQQSAVNDQPQAVPVAKNKAAVAPRLMTKVTPYSYNAVLQSEKDVIMDVWDAVCSCYNKDHNNLMKLYYGRFRHNDENREEKLKALRETLLDIGAVVPNQKLSLNDKIFRGPNAISSYTYCRANIEDLKQFGLITDEASKKRFLKLLQRPVILKEIVIVAEYTMQLIEKNLNMKTAPASCTCNIL